MKENISKKTVELFTEVLVARPSDITALFVLADYNFYSNNHIISKSYYQKLLSLIDKNSLEYNEIYKFQKELEAKAIDELYDMRNSDDDELESTKIKKRK